MADGFLGRWSQRKQDVRDGKKPREEPAVDAAAASPPPGAAPAPFARAGASHAQQMPGAAREATEAASEPLPAPPPPTLSDAQALTPASDFKPFVARAVPPEVRNLAMKKLFADPHFNVMDGLDIYVGDYTQPDPLPAGMLRKMASAHALGFFDHEKAQQEPPAQAAAPGSAQEGAPAPPLAIAPEAAQPRDCAQTVPAPDVAQSGLGGAASDAAPSEPPAAPCSAEDAAAPPASHTENDHDAHLRLQPDDAPGRQGIGRGTA